MERREHDIMMDMIANQGMSFDNLVTVGLNANNTSLQDKSTYENNEWVREHFKDQYGEFDKIALEAFYNNAKVYYNALASANYDESMKRQATYHRDNIFAPIEQRRKGPEFVEFQMANPYQTTSSIYELGRIGERTKSIDELAQSNKVLLNPTTAGDNLENAQWGDTPNDSFWGYFTDTLVMAQYDSDGTHIDPFTGEQVEHKAGDLKLDNTGNFYYEKLDGRDIYGRRVLNKMNVLTTDGSFWNQYDFFDSDDLNQKSIGGTVLKNLALVGTMFIPYVGPWIAGLSIATQAAGLLGTLGKMAEGSDSPTWSALEGWSKSVSRQGATSEYAQEHTWCWENFINLIGDVAGQLKEQRFIFEKVPYVFKGANMMSKEGQAAKLAALKEKQMKLVSTKMEDLRRTGANAAELVKAEAELKTVAALKAQAELDSFIKGYNKIGEVLSKGYMTAITVGDTYGEAKHAGASDLDATLLTLGYAAGEYAILNTGLGEWILPELRAGRYRAQAIARALTSVDAETQNLYRQFGRQLSNFSKEGKKEYTKKLFNIGRDIARAEYATGAKTLKATLAAGTGEGVEEVSEELLADFSKGCYDVVKWLQGDDTRLNTFGYDFGTGTWNGREIVDRYGMSLVGGFVGGGLTNAATNYKMINNLSSINSEQAIQEVVYMARNGGIDKFMKQVNKMQLGDPNMSTDFEMVDGVPVFAPGTKENNQDAVVKAVLTNQVKMIQGILSANGAVSDSRFLDAQTLGDLRFNALHKSATAGRYLQEYNSLHSKLIRLTQTINDKINAATDTNQDGVSTDREQRRAQLSTEDQAAIKNLEKEIKETKQQMDDLVSGKRAYEFIADSLFEMTSALSSRFTATTFPLFAEQKYNKKFSELTDEEKAKALESYKNWKTTEGREQLHTLAQIYRQVAEQSSQVIKQHEQTYLQTSQELMQLNKVISNLYTVQDGKYLPIVNDSDFLELSQKAAGSNLVDLRTNLVTLLGTEEDAAELTSIRSRLSSIDPNATEEEKKNQRNQVVRDYADKLDDVLMNNIQQFVQPFLERGFANAETKNQLSELLRVVHNRTVTKAGQMDEWLDNEYDPFSGPEPVNVYATLAQGILATLRAVDALNATPLEQNLNEFAISIGNEPVKLTELTQRLNTSFNDTSDNITKFNMDEQLYKDLNNAIYTMELYQASILGARTDAANLGNIFGYNATLNEVAAKVEGSEQPQLAEIDSHTADVFVADIDANLNKLKFLKRLYEVNQGQKLSKQDRVATKKDLLIYKRLKHIVSILDDDPLKDWEGFLELQNAINGMVIHDELLRTNNTTVSEAQREAFEKEKLAAENAIYDFFQIESNKQKLNDPAKLAELINPRKLQLYTEAKELLNEGLDNLDDNSLVWWIASRAALRSQNFYFQYRQIIDPQAENPMAPIATQELAIYNNYASIVNGNVFTAFYNAYRYAIVENWKQRSVEERKNIWKSLGKPESVSNSLSIDELSDYVLNMGFTPRYSNVVLTEGIPGSGKSTGVFQSTLKLLKQFHPELLSNVAVIHGANPDSATKLRDDVGLTQDNSKTYGRSEWMREINPNWKDYPMAESDGAYQIPKNDYQVTNENEIRSRLGIKDTTTPPSLIILDEISKFSAYDFDQIDAFARKYGITVLAAGDFDQSGVVAKHTVDLGSQKNLPWQASLSRTNFIRSPKLGVSMRTDNSLKTTNLQKMQAYMQEPNGTVEFNYFQDETGLFGDKLYQYSDSVKDVNIDQILNDIQAMIDTLREGQKIGYIYTDKTSPIYAILSQDQYKNFIDFREGGSAQGLEGQYYIIEANPNVSTDEYLKDIYTGISRAQQGSIIIAPVKKDMVKFDSFEVSEKISEQLATNVIANFAQKRKDVLDKVASDGQVSDIIPRTSEVPTQPQAPAGPTTPGGLEAGIDSTPLPTPEPPVATTPSAPQQPVDPNTGNPQSPETNLSDLAREITQKAGITTEVARKTIHNSDNLYIGGLELDNLPPNARYVDSHGIAKGDEIEKLLNLLINGIDPNRRFDTAPLGRGDSPEGAGAALGTAGGTSYRQGLFIIATNPSEGFGDNYNLLSTTGIKTVLINTGDPDTPECLEVAQNLKAELSSRFPNVDFILYTEAADYYKNKQPVSSEPAAEQVPQVEPLVYEDDQAPITQTDVINDQTYQQQLDQSSASENTPQSSVVANAEHVSIEMLLHTFNTFETGVAIDNNGMPVPVGSQAWMDARIDSVNGLIKIDNALGKPVRTVQEYVNLIGRLRNILFNTSDKSQIQEKIQNVLGLSGIYCTFALKSSPRPDAQNRTQGREFVSSKPNPFDKGISEQTLFNGSSDTRSHEWHPKSLVVIIGTKESGNLLELPLIALSSPFTLLQTKDINWAQVFSQMFNRYDQLLKQGETLHRIAEILVSDFDGIPQFQELVDLFKLYNFTDAGVFYINDQQWTPVRDLQLLGPQFVTDKGYYQEAPGLFMNDTTNPEAEWISLQEFTQNPQCYVTKKVMISMTGMIDGSDKPIVNAGHPFVLVSYNRELNTDKKVIRQYIKQQTDPTARQEVKLMYVLPPKATIRDYLTNLHKILQKENGVENIGNLFTSYKLLKILMQDDAFRSRVEEKIKPGASQVIEAALQELESLNQAEQKNTLYEVKDWTELGFGQQKLAGLFDAVISNIAFDRNTVGNGVTQERTTFNGNEADTRIIEEALLKAGVDGVYYKVKLPKDASSVEGMMIPEQGAGYTIAGKPFKIHGKLDSYTFKGSMGGIISQALSKIHQGNNGHFYSTDNFTYFNWQTQTIGNSNLAEPPVRNRQETESERLTRNTIEYVRRKLGIDVSSIFQGKSIQEAHKQIVEQINSTDNQVVAFTIGNELLISEKSSILGGTLFMYDSNGQPITDITALAGNTGKYVFTVVHNLDGRSVEATVEYNSVTKEMSLMDPVESSEIPQTISVTPENFTAYVESGRTILEDVFLYDMELENAFAQTTYEGFMQALNEMIYLEGDLRVDYLNELLPQADDMQKQIINDLIAIERSHDPNKQDPTQQDGESCPIVIKIKF